MLAAHKDQIPHVCCLIRSRRIFVTSVETAGNETILTAAGCCSEAIQELRRWLDIDRPVLPRPIISPSVTHQRVQRLDRISPWFWMTS